MKSRVTGIIFGVLALLILLDLYFHFSIYRFYLANAGKVWIPAYLILNAVVLLGIMARILLMLYSFQRNPRPALISRVMSFSGLILFFYAPKLFFLPFSLLADVISAFAETGILQVIAGVFRVLGTGLAAFAVMLISLGVFYGRFRLITRHFTLEHPDLPSSFDGLKIVHISDLHTGSLTRHRKRFLRATDMINAADADLVLFTGDMVNNFAGELEGWEAVLGDIKSRRGKYAILGNHDYGEYHDWPDQDSWRSNMEELKEAEQRAGFRLLLNESVPLRVNGAVIRLAGVENWGLPPFRQYGDLQSAMSGVKNGEFTILMSHDPSHWDEEVVGKTGINLTLSGHTHGMQFGIRKGRFRWSPVSLKYPRWGGWYREGNQYLHVSTGLGYIGFPVRLGMPPEIAVIELYSK